MPVWCFVILFLGSGEWPGWVMLSVVLRGGIAVKDSGVEFSAVDGEGFLHD